MIDLTGERFSRLLVLSQAPRDGKRSISWHCKCDCGNEKIIDGASMRHGRVRSCGCLLKEKAAQRVRAMNTTHGKCGTIVYHIWQAMKARCSNPNNKDYSRYGGRGISVCEQWKNSFEQFALDMGLIPGPGYSIDRRNNDGNYEPSNCLWKTPRHQANNRWNNRVIEYRGVPLTLENALRVSKTSLSRECVRQRINDGWDATLALETPRNATYRGKFR